MANNNTFSIIILIVLIVGGIYVYNNYYKPSLNVESEGNEDLNGNTDIQIKVTFCKYDGTCIDGGYASIYGLMATQTIPNRNLPNIPIGFDYEILEITVTNTGNVDLDMSVSDFILTGYFTGTTPVTRYSCLGTSCIVDTNGPYITSDCDNECVIPKYKCSGSSCIRDDVGGTYTTSNCNNACVVVTPKYKCSGTSCIRDDTSGTYTTSNCNNACTVSTTNLVNNPGFEQGKTSWDFRGISEFNIDTSIYHSGSASFRSDPGACGDRSIWQNYLSSVTPGDTLKFTGSLRHSGCSGSNCAVSSTSAGILYGCCVDRGSGYGDQCPISRPVWADRGGARLGMDFRNSGGSIIYECMLIYDWTMPANTWQDMELIMTVPTNADNVIVWIQGHRCDSPASIWLDDVSLVVI